jgi:ssDNA-binding Zn-finger/Zn-ribbon topoisomerase 1
MTTRRFIGKDGQPNGLLKCSRNPDCDHIEWAERKVAPLPGEGRKCEACGKGTMRTKEIPDKAKGGRIRILGCSRYPDCRNTEFQDDKKKTNGATGGARSSTAPRGRAVGRG